VADLHAAIKSLAKLVIKAKGGEGVIKELSELLGRNISNFKKRSI